MDMSVDSHTPGLTAARMRWRAAGESLFPTLTADPSGYAGAVEAIGAMASALRQRNARLEDLVAAVASPEGLVAELGVRVPPGLPVGLLVGVACGMRERELITEQVRRERSTAITRARENGSSWAVLHGPDQVEDLTGGMAGGPAGCTHLHLPSGAELRATVDAWSREPYRVDVVPAGGTAPTGRSFTERGAWLEEFHRARDEIEE